MKRLSPRTSIYQLEWREGLSLLLWLSALISYFLPWIWRSPPSAALLWNAYDMFDLLRYLPEIETGALSVHLQALRLPLLSLAMLPSLLLMYTGRPLRLAAAGIGVILAAMTFPPYPHILTAWRTPGWCVPFWWAVAVIICIGLLPWITLHHRRHRDWAITAAVLLATLPSAQTLLKLLPALSRLHAAPVRPGRGFWGCLASLSLIGVLTWWHDNTPPASSEQGAAADDTASETSQEDTSLAELRALLERHQDELLRKPNVVAVGIGLPAGQRGTPSQRPGIVVSVTHKLAADTLTPEEQIPDELEGVPVWVQEIGTPRAR